MAHFWNNTIEAWHFLQEENCMALQYGHPGGRLDFLLSSGSG